MSVRRILLGVVAALCLTACSTLGYPAPQHAVSIEGVSAEHGLSCQASEINFESKVLYKRWAELNEKMAADILTTAELYEGLEIARSRLCFDMKANLPGTVVLVEEKSPYNEDDYYLVDYCVPGHDCIMVIQKSYDFIEN